MAVYIAKRTKFCFYARIRQIFFDLVDFARAGFAGTATGSHFRDPIGR